MGTISKRRLRNTSAHRRRELATEQTSEPWHQALLASMHDVVLVADIDGTFTYCSPSVEARSATGRTSSRGRTSTT